MEENEFLLALVGTLDKKKSKRQIMSDIRELEKVLRNIRLTATLAKGESKKSLNLAAKQLEGQLRHIKLQAKIDRKNLKADVDKALQNISFKDIDLGVDTGKTKFKVQKAIADVKKTIQNTPISLNIDLKKEKLNNQLTSYLSKNSKIRESEGLLKEADQLREKIAGINDRDSLRNATDSFQLFRSECSALGYQAKSSSERIRNLIGNVTKIGSALGVASLAVSNFQKSLRTINKNDDILTEISKTSNSTKQELEELGNSAFDTASKFGKVSSDYLTAIQEMNRSGFYGEAGKALGELTLLTQAAGDVTAETAQKYLLATSAAYGYAGNVEKLNGVLDGQNTITNKWSVDMETMATATEKAGSMAANTGVKIEELSAMIGTISARTKEAGTITGTGIKALLVNLQNISSEKITATLKKANASMTETVDGVEKLRTPIAILKDLAKTYNSLAENDPLKSEITTNIGGKHHANQLSALLSGWADFEKMLVDYSNGAGSALEEANKSANSLTGRLNALQNTWDELVNSIINKSTIKSGVGFFDGILQSVTKIIDAVDVLPVALAGITAFMTAKNKDMGLHILNNKGKFDLSGNFMGIVDIDQIKHYKAAKEAVSIWNKEIKTGQADIDKLNLEVVKNNAQLRNYLSTCNDGSASLKGYKQSLQAAGEATNSLRLGTILLNTAVSFGLGLAIQSVISLITKAAQRTEDLCAKASELGNEFSGTSSDIDSYKSRIEELQKTINDSGSSIDDVTNARKELMSIQTEMINKYGQETEKVNAITEAINGQVFALERLKKAEWYDTKSNYNAKTVDDHVLDFLTKTIPYVFEKVMLLGDDGKMEMPKTRLEETLDRWEAQTYSLKSTGNAKLDDLLSKSFSMPLVDGKFQLAGSVDDLKEKLGAIKEVVAGYELPADFQESLSDVSQDVQSIYESTSNIRNQAVLYDKILSDDPANAYDEAYEKLERLKAGYDEAVFSGDTDRVNNAAESYAGALSEAMQLAKDHGDFDVAEYFEDMYPELRQAVGEWRFNIDFDADTNGLEERIREALNALQDFSIEDIDQFNVNIATDEQIQAYGALKQAAINYGLSVGQLVSLLEQMGLVQSENYQKLVSLFGEDNIRKLTPDELVIAYKIENTGNMTFEELQDAIAQAKQEAEDIKPISFKEAWKALDNTDNESLKDLKEDLLELAKQGKLTVAEFKKTTGANTWLKEIGISAEEAVKKINKLKEVSSADQLASMGSSIKALSDNLATKKESPKKAIDYDTLAGMSDELKECTEAWRNYEKVMGTASSTYGQCREATNKLATAFINSNNFLAKLTTGTKDYYISQLQAMGISNAEAIVTAMLTQKHMEAAEAKQIESAKNEVLAITKNGVTNETLKEVSALLQQQGATKNVWYAIVDLIAQEQILANTSLGVDSKIEQLNILAETYYGAAAAASFMNQVQTSADGALSSGEVTSPGQAWDNVTNTHKPKKFKAPKIPKVNIPTPTISPTNYSTPKPSSSGDKGKSAKAKESKQEVDWISRVLDKLQSKVDILKAKFETLFSTGSKNNNLNKQIKQTTKLLKAQEKAASKYQKVADQFYKKNQKKFSKNGISLSMLQNGTYDIKSYKSGIAQLIQTYEGYYDKVQDSKKATWELVAAIKELSKQKLDLSKEKLDKKLDKNEKKRSYQEARYANATTAEEKNKILDKEIPTYTADNKAYKEYYQATKKQRNKDGKSAKTAVTKTKGLGKKIKKKIKQLIKQKKEIPDNLMKKVLAVDKNTYALLANYNDSVDSVADALRDKKLANEQNKTNIREAKVEKQQNLADKAEAKYNLNQQYESNAGTAKDKNKYEAKSMKNLEEEYKHLIQIAKLEGDVTEKKRLQAELEAKRKESYQKQYDNIKTEHDNKTALNDADISIVKARIETLEAAGKTVSKSMYEGLMKMNSNRKEILLKDFADLQEAGKDFEYGSDEWYKWQLDLLAAGQGLEECTQETINLQKAINALDFKKFELKAAQLDATKSHLEFLVDMLSHKDLTSKESGGLTDEGMATISLRFAGIENYKETIKNAQNDLATLYAQHEDGSDKLTEEEFLEKREEQLDIIRQSTEAIADEKDAIIDLVEDALQLQIDSINELIEKKKKALATEKDLYEYQRKVAKQTKNIALIQKQIAALSGDKSEEARARIQKLQLSLEEAQEDLKETEYDKWHSDQEDMLDNLADEVEDFWEKVMDDLKKNLDDSLGNIERMISENPEAVAKALYELGLGDALSIITTYNPDGTHTDKATDYNGNTYESTYDETGENVKNQFKIDKNPAEGIVESNEGVKGTLDEVVGKLNKDSLGDKLQELIDKMDQEKNQDKDQDKDDTWKKDLMDKSKAGEGEKLAGTGKQENTLNTVTTGKNMHVLNAGDSSVAKVKKFLKETLRKPKTEAEEKRMKSDPLLKYLAKNYDGKTLSKANEAKLGALFGISVDKDNISEAKAKKIRDSLKNAGFAKGGIAETIRTVTLENGDEGIATLQRGEAVLDKKQTEIMQRLAERGLELAEPQYKLTDEQIRHFQESVGLIDYSDIRPKFDIPPSNTTNTSVNIGDVNIHLDGSGIVDPKSFCDTFRRSNEMQKAVQDATVGQIGLPYAKTLIL